MISFDRQSVAAHSFLRNYTFFSLGAFGVGVCALCLTKPIEPTAQKIDSAPLSEFVQTLASSLVLEQAWRGPEQLRADLLTYHREMLQRQNLMAQLEAEMYRRRTTFDIDIAAQMSAIAQIQTQIAALEEELHQISTHVDEHREGITLLQPLVKIGLLKADQLHQRQQQLQVHEYQLQQNQNQVQQAQNLKAALKSQLAKVHAKSRQYKARTKQKMRALRRKLLELQDDITSTQGHLNTFQAKLPKSSVQSMRLK